MYLGVTAHHNVLRVMDYESAVKAQRAGTMRSKVASVYERSDGAIAFRLYQTDVVVWNPDNSVEIDNYGSQTTSGFAKRFLPCSIYLNYPTVRRNMIGGANTIQFHTHPDRPDLSWEDRYHVCQGSIVRFTEQDGAWLPDESTCYDIRLPVGMDRKKFREVAKRYHLKEFENWLSMAPIHLDIHHVEWDTHTCMAALEAREFRVAAEALPTILETSAFGLCDRTQPLPIHTLPGKYISMASLAKLKLAIQDHEGLRVDEVRRTWSVRDYNNGMKRVRELSNLGMAVHDLGPRT
mgnify:CR=1 FL=1